MITPMYTILDLAKSIDPLTITPDQVSQIGVRWFGLELVAIGLMIGITTGVSLLLHPMIKTLTRRKKKIMTSEYQPS